MKGGAHGCVPPNLCSLCDRFFTERPVSCHQADAGGGSQGGGYRRKDGDGKVDDFL